MDPSHVQPDATSGRNAATFNPAIRATTRWGHNKDSAAVPRPYKPKTAATRQSPAATPPKAARTPNLTAPLP
ncbi:hypothetical protein Acsp04_57080 [Actinomadura sp. NBRC 104425]|nr:hypothetical protein Acsp04_57080 [Actinomadura sp. NBRC 104425]